MEEAYGLSPYQCQFESDLGYKPSYQNWHMDTAKDRGSVGSIPTEGILPDQPNLAEAMVSEIIQYQFESDIGYAGVLQRAEGIGLNPIQCEFESHRLYYTIKG